MAMGYQNNKSLFQKFLVLFFIGVSLIVLLPILNVVAVSLSSKVAIDSGIVGIIPKAITFEAYKLVMKDASVMRAFFFSIFLVVLSTVISMIGTILAAYPLSRKRFKHRKKIMLLIVITMYFNAGIIPNYMLVRNLGLLNSIWALIVPGMISAYNLIVLRSFFSAINESMFEAAYIDGANEFQVLWKIVIPLSMPAILTLSLFYAVSRWNSVQDVIFYINNPNLYTMQLKLKQMLDLINVPVTEIADYPVVAENLKAASIIFTMIPMLVIYPFIQRYFTKGLTLGGVKE